MRNIISIDTRDGCSCNAIVATDTKTNEIVIEVITGNDKKPQLKLINGEDTSYITLDANQSNYVNIPSESWVLGGALQFQYEATGRTGELYTISFPDTINDITVSQISETEFNVKSLVIGTQPLTVKDIINNLSSTDIYKVLSANMGGVLDGKITNVNENVTKLSGSVITLSEYVNGLAVDVETLAKILNIKNVSGGDFNKLGEENLDAIGNNMANAPISNTACSYIIQQTYAGGRILQYAKPVNWSSGELLYFRQRRSADYWDNWYRVATDADITYVQNDINFLSARWVTKSTGVKGTVTFDVSQYASFLLFCQWAGANLYAIYYINMNNGVVALINSNSGAWTVTVSSDHTKLNISNENGSNQWADYRLLRID